MKALTDYEMGDALPSLCLPALTRHTLALYCGGSGDHNPLHTDIDFARRAGLPDVIGHGMLTMAFIGRMLIDLAGPQSLSEFEVKFVGMAQIGDEIECRGRVAEVDARADEALLRVEVTAQVGPRVLAEGGAVLRAML